MNERVGLSVLVRIVMTTTVSRIRACFRARAWMRESSVRKAFGRRGLSASSETRRHAHILLVAAHSFLSIRYGVVA